MVMISLEGLKYRQIGEGALSYFKDVEHALHNGISTKKWGIGCVQVKVMK